jgi:transcriptional regulator
MRANSFAILCARQEDQLVATHLPLLLETDGASSTLIGHVAKANQVHKLGYSEILAIFHGPHAYVSPTWYGEPGYVPTWNYVAVHAYGPLQVVTDAAQTIAIIERTVAFYEPAVTGWRMSTLPPEKREALLNAIVAFRIPITKIEGKWKLSQNHTVQRRSNLAVALQGVPDQNSQAIAALMRSGLHED